MLRILLILFILTIGCCFHSCKHADRESKIEIPLNVSWELGEINGKTWISAHVPGSVASDLLENQKNGKGFHNLYKNFYQTSWVYQTAFNVSPEMESQDSINLCFKGLGPYSSVYLNDTLLFQSDNIFRTWVINCKMLLKVKDNHLRIVIQGTKKRMRLQDIHQNKNSGNPGIGLSVDWQYDEYKLFNPGIWGPVMLQAWSVAKIEDLGIQPDLISQRKADYHANISITSVEKQNVTLEFLINNRPVLAPVNLSLDKGHNFYRTLFTIVRPRFWWINGLGDPYLYQITVRMKKGSKLIQEFNQRLGVRTISFISTQNTSGKGCYFKLNGTPVFIKGAILTDSYHRHANPDVYYKNLVESSNYSNINLLRVSDKGIYADDVFYNLCDENGILVWQDFMVNHDRVVGDSGYFQSFNQEAIEEIKRLRNHPCMAIWWGNDQDTMALYGKRKYAQFKSMAGNRAGAFSKYFEVSLPKLVGNYGYSTTYQYFKFFTGENTTPATDLLNGQRIGNFILNFGIPALTISKVTSKNSNHEILGTNYNAAKLSCKHTDKQEFTAEDKILDTYIKKNYGVSKDYDTIDFERELAQSDLLKTTIENHRINMPECMGTIYDQIWGNGRDLSYSTIDSSGRWKPAQYSIKDAYAHVLVVAVREKGMVIIYGISDAFKDMDAILLVRLINFRGKALYVQQIPVDIKANSSKMLLKVNETELLRRADVSQCCLVVQLNQSTKTLSQNLLYFTEYKNLRLGKPSIDLDINEALKGYNIILKSSVLVKNMFIRTHLKNCWFSENNFDLLPGKRFKINVRFQGPKADLAKDIQIWSFTTKKSL